MSIAKKRRTLEAIALHGVGSDAWEHEIATAPTLAEGTALERWSRGFVSSSEAERELLSGRWGKWRKKNPSAAQVAGGTATVLGALAPLIPYALLGFGAWYLYRRFMSGFGGEAVAGAAHAASAVPEAYGQAARTALDPSQWPAAYQQANQAWQAAGGQGSPIAGPYYGPAGPWGGRDDAAPVPPDQGGGGGGGP